MVNMIIEILIERGITVVAQLTFQGLGASYADSETAVAQLTFQGLGVSHTGSETATVRLTFQGFGADPLPN